MLKNTANFMLFVLLGAVLFVTSCKKDPFSEKDALQAQKELLAQKFGYDLAIANVSLQIQRAGDSARIAIQNLVNSGATALERERLASALALKLADYNHLLNELRSKDSLNRIQAYVESIGGVRSYQIRVVDFSTKAPINGATVKVLPWGASAFASVKTNSDGIAIMNNVIIDPQAIFYANDENTGVTSATTMVRREALSGLVAGTGNPTIEVYRFSTATGTNTISGSLLHTADLTTGAGGNAGAGRTVTATYILSTTGGTTGPNGAVTGQEIRWERTGVTGTTGAYSIAVPKLNSTWTVSIPSTTSYSAVQKMYVNYFDGENPLTSVPRIDSGTFTFSLAGSSAFPHVSGYYFRLKADSLSGSPVILTDRALRPALPAYVGGPTVQAEVSSNFMTNLIGALSLDVRAADGKSVDTLRSHFAYNVSNMIINNGWGNQFYNYAIRLDSTTTPGTVVAVQDTIPVEFVNLTSNGLMSEAPELVAIIGTNGKLLRIETKRATSTSTVNIGFGGRFAVNAYALGYDMRYSDRYFSTTWITGMIRPVSATTGFAIAGDPVFTTGGVVPQFANRANNTPTGSSITVNTTATATSAYTSRHFRFAPSSYPVK
jgi:hypothetical protein